MLKGEVVNAGQLAWGVGRSVHASVQVLELVKAALRSARLENDGRK